MSEDTFPGFLRKLLELGLEHFGLYYGTYRATVMDNNDPDKLGRVQIRVGAIHGDRPCERWAWPISPWAGNGYGLWFVPDIGSTVYVVFDHGQADHPLWSGSWWGDGEPTADMTTKKVVIATKEGMKLVLDRTNKSVTVEQSSGTSLFMDDSVVTLATKEGMKVALDRSAKKATVEQGSGNSVVMSSTKCEVSHSIAVAIKSPKIDLDGVVTCTSTLTAGILPVELSVHKHPYVDDGSPAITGQPIPTP